MRQRLSGLRKVASLSQSMNQRLNMYALAASAAGVSLLACSPPAEAKVIFTNTWIPITPSTVTNIDLTNGGTVDFVISNKLRSYSCGEFNGPCVTQKMLVLPQGSGNAVWGTGTAASALGSGVNLGSKGPFQQAHQFMAGSFRLYNRYGTPDYSSKGNWTQTINRFLGVKFMIQGEVHYGWVRMDVSPTMGGMYGAISGYAYESVPNKSIRTGQKSGAVKQRNSGKPGSASVDAPAPTQGSLGVLALGALGLQK